MERVIDVSELRDSARRQIRRNAEQVLDSTVRAFTIELRRRLARFSRNDVQALAYRMREITHEGVVEAARQADPDALADARHAESTIHEGTEALIAFADPGGAKRPTGDALRALTGIAGHLGEVLATVDSVFGPVRSHTLANCALDRSSLHLEVEPLEDDFDSALYERLLADDWMWPTAIADSDAIRAALTYASGGRVDLPGDLDDFDRIHEDVTGCSFGDFLRVVHSLSKHDRPASGVRRSADFPFADEISARSGVDSGRAARAITRLILPASEMADAYALPRTFASRAATTRWRPIVLLSDRSLVYGPSTFAMPLQVSYVKAALSGSWPFPLTNPADRALASHLQRRRASLRPIVDFESRVRTEVSRSTLGRNCAFNVEPHESLHTLGVNIRGELDAVAADPARNVLWVISAKDSQQVLTKRQIRNQLDEFYGGTRGRVSEKSHTGVLGQRISEISQAPNAVATRLGVLPTRTDAEWAVRGLFVTRVVSPAAADRRARFPLMLLSRLRQHLNNPPTGLETTAIDRSRA